VTIYNTGTSPGAISFTGSGRVNLSAPSSGTYANVLLFQDRLASVAATISGQGNLSLAGAIYLPGAALNLSGQGTLTADAVGSILANSVIVTGQGQIRLTSSTSTYRNVRLVE
jgi:hypothetical protein